MANHMTTRGKQIRHEHAQTHTDYLKSASPLAFVIQINCLACSFCFTDILNRSKMTHNQTGRSVSLRHTIKKRRCHHHLTTFTHTALVCSETYLHWYTQTHIHITVALKQVNTWSFLFLLSASVKLKF